MLNVRGERISEAMFLGSLKRAVSQWPGAELLDYCCAESSILGKLLPTEFTLWARLCTLKGQVTPNLKTNMF